MHERPSLRRMLISMAAISSWRRPFLYKTLSWTNRLRIILQLVVSRRQLQTATWPQNMTVLRNYQNAIAALNGLQSNAQAIEKARRDRGKNVSKNIPWMERLLEIVGVEVGQLDALNVIHVSGTKGKGSTCAFTESLLRHLGYRTGFYSSPHLVAVRERIRLNGVPIAEQAFTTYFWEVYDRLHAACSPDEMPPYFKFLTVMSYYVFLKEKVDVAVVEVGIGGAYDSTNVIRRPLVCGVTSLGFDHIAILGSTLSEIAWNKAGIFKPGCPAVTIPQPDEAMQMLHSRAEEIGTNLFLAPPLQMYPTKNGPIKLGLEGQVQSSNASLALQLVRLWLSRVQSHLRDVSEINNISRDENWLPSSADPDSCAQIPGTDFADIKPGITNIFLHEVGGYGEISSSEAAQQNGHCGIDKNGTQQVATSQLVRTLAPLAINEVLCRALEQCVWPGRFARITHGNIDYYLDGAHTKESVNYCAEWYRKISQCHGMRHRVLLFNSTADRKPEDLLLPLMQCGFDVALFCPNIVVNDAISVASDLANFTVNREQQVGRCVLQETVWRRLCQNNNGTCEKTLCVASVREALEWIEKRSRTEGDGYRTEILVTGSLHLVGAVLSVLDPTLQHTL